MTPLPRCLLAAGLLPLLPLYMQHPALLRVRSQDVLTHPAERMMK
mgnify:CR=1 FL=1